MRRREVEFRWAMRERQWQYERLERVLELVSTYCNAILSVLNRVLSHVMFDRLESELRVKS